MPQIPLRISGRELRPYKPIVAPLLGTKTVLTNSPWGFVSLWLKRTQKDDALFFWNQAREFHQASVGMSLQSSPLLLYYSFMNAVKALLAAKGIAFNPYHGIVANSQRGNGGRISLSNEGVRIKQQGVLPALSTYLGETEVHVTHTLQELLFNLPFIHRTYCLTYSSQPDMFIPLTECQYVLDTQTMHAHLRATLSRDFAHRRFIKRLPATIIADPQGDGIRAVRSRDEVAVASRSLGSDADRNTIVAFNRRIRADILYIQGTQALWYIKGRVSGPTRIARFPITLTLAAMHRLSELCRYHPFELASLLAGQKNWLLSEFIQLAPDQFIDEVASEITGHQFLAPNVRVAT